MLVGAPVVERLEVFGVVLCLVEPTCLNAQFLPLLQVPFGENLQGLAAPPVLVELFMRSVISSSLNVLNLVVDCEVQHVEIDFVKHQLIHQQHVQGGHHQAELGAKETVDEDVRHLRFAFSS